MARNGCKRPRVFSTTLVKFIRVIHLFILSAHLSLWPSPAWEYIRKNECSNILIDFREFYHWRSRLKWIQVKTAILTIYKKNVFVHLYDSIPEGPLIIIIFVKLKTKWQRVDLNPFHASEESGASSKTSALDRLATLVSMRWIQLFNCFVEWKNGITPKNRLFYIVVLI